MTDEEKQLMFRASFVLCPWCSKPCPGKLTCDVVEKWIEDFKASSYILEKDEENRRKNDVS